METFLLIIGIVGVILTVFSFGLSGLFLYAYMYTMDGSFETYQMQKMAFIIFGILTIVLLIATIIVFKKRKTAKSKK